MLQKIYKLKSNNKNMFKPLSPEEYRALALSRYPTLNPEFKRLNLWEKTDGWNNPQNMAPIYLGVAQLNHLKSRLANIRIDMLRSGKNIEVRIQHLDGIIRVHDESKPDGLCGDPLNPETVEGRLYLREEFEPHIEVPEALGKDCEEASKRIFQGISLSPEVLIHFPEFKKQYLATSFKDMRYFALKNKCGQAQIESPLFEVYPRYDSIYVVPIDVRAELLINEKNLKILN